MYDIIYWQQLTFRRALPSVTLSLFLSLSPLFYTYLAWLPPPRDRFSRHFSAPLLFLSLSLSPRRCLSFSHLTLHSRTRLFSIGLMVYYVSCLLSLLARALTFSFHLSSPLSPISQSYPRQRKMPGVSQSRERPAFSRDLWRPFAQLAAPMSRSVVNILAGPTDRWMDAPTGPRRCCLSYDRSDITIR